MDLLSGLARISKEEGEKRFERKAAATISGSRHGDGSVVEITVPSSSPMYDALQYAFVIALDVSGSMGQDAERVVEAVEEVRQILSLDGLSVAVVLFSNTAARLAVEELSVENAKSVMGYAWHGGTKFAPALRLGFNFLSNSRGPKTIVFMTDGVAHDESEWKAEIRRIRSHTDLKVRAAGFGPQASPKDLLALCDGRAENMSIFKHLNDLKEYLQLVVTNELGDSVRVPSQKATVRLQDGKHELAQLFLVESEDGDAWRGTLHRSAGSPEPISVTVLGEEWQLESKRRAEPSTDSVVRLLKAACTLDLGSMVENDRRLKEAVGELQALVHVLNTDKRDETGALRLQSLARKLSELPQLPPAAQEVTKTKIEDLLRSLMVQGARKRVQEKAAAKLSQVDEAAVTSARTLLESLQCRWKLMQAPAADPLFLVAVGRNAPPVLHDGPPSAELIRAPILEDSGPEPENLPADTTRIAVIFGAKLLMGLPSEPSGSLRRQCLWALATAVEHLTSPDGRPSYECLLPLMRALLVYGKERTHLLSVVASEKPLMLFGAGPNGGNPFFETPLMAMAIWSVQARPGQAVPENLLLALLTECLRCSLKTKHWQQLLQEFIENIRVDGNKISKEMLTYNVNVSQVQTIADSAFCGENAVMNMAMIEAVQTTGDPELDGLLPAVWRLVGQEESALDVYKFLEKCLGDRKTAPGGSCAWYTWSELMMWARHHNHQQRRPPTSRIVRAIREAFWSLHNSCRSEEWNDLAVHVGTPFIPCKAVDEIKSDARKEIAKALTSTDYLAGVAAKDVLVLQRALELDDDAQERVLRRLMKDEDSILLVAPTFYKTDLQSRLEDAASEMHILAKLENVFREEEARREAKRAASITGMIGVPGSRTFHRKFVGAIRPWMKAELGTGVRSKTVPSMDPKLFAHKKGVPSEVCLVDAKAAQEAAFQSKGSLEWANRLDVRVQLRDRCNVDSCEVVGLGPLRRDFGGLWYLKEACTPKEEPYVRIIVEKLLSTSTSLVAMWPSDDDKHNARAKKKNLERRLHSRVHYQHLCKVCGIPPGNDEWTQI